MKFRSAGEALVHKLGEVLASGQTLVVRGAETRELTHQHFAITAPRDRAAVVHGRHGDIFASIAETLWVLAGRNDVAFIAGYLPRAPQFSDDGMSWRGGYGPRIRNWAGVDQVAQVVNLLKEDRESRRAVISIFDPAQDFVDSRDIPCTNWLQVEIRDDRLNISVAMRSNDLIWGFSGINAFEWSVLQEMLAFWLEAEIGELHFYVGSLHLYQRHYERAHRIVGGPGELSAPSDTPSLFATSFAEFEGSLNDWFAFEAAVRTNHGTPTSLLDSINDPLLRDYALMIAAHWQYQLVGPAEGATALARVADSALRYAGAEVFAWRSNTELERAPAVDYRELRDAVISLHRHKDAAYGDSWKRRGERGSILPNIARKVDRFRKYDPASLAPDSETWLDTSVDLLVYAVKYRGYLMDLDGASPPPGQSSWSDTPGGFEQLLPAFARDAGHIISDDVIEANAILDEFEELIENGSSIAARIELTDRLVDVAQQMTLQIADGAPWRTRAALRLWM